MIVCHFFESGGEEEPAPQRGDILSFEKARQLTLIHNIIYIDKPLWMRKLFKRIECAEEDISDF